MVRIENSTILDCPVEAIWRFLSDPGNLPKWYDGTLEMRQTSAGPITIGTTYEAVVQAGGRSLVIRAMCTVLDPNKEVAWEFISGVTKRSKDTWRMEPIDEKSTRVTRIFDLSVSGFWRLIQPIVVQGTKKSHEAEINSVKHILESPPQA